jgi:tetratricopeptide (TPR) repeat protein
VFGDLGLGNACLLLGDIDHAVPLLRKLRRTAHRLGRYRDWLSASIKLAQSLVLNQNQDEAWKIVNGDRFERAVTGLPQGDPLRVDAWALTGRVQSLLGRHGEAELAYLRAVAVLENDGLGSQHWQRVKLLLELGKARQAQQNHEDAWEAFSEGERLAESAGYEQLRAAHALHAIITLARMGRLEEAEERLRALHVQREGTQRIEAWTRLARGEILWARGDEVQARCAYESAAKALAGTLAETNIRVLIARRRTKTENVDGACEGWARARESARNTGHWHSYRLATVRYAEHLRQAGRRDKARELVEDLVAEKAPIAPSIIESAQAILHADN